MLPLLMAAASLLLPLADSPRRAALLFGLAGLGCSAFYPLTVGLASRRFPGHVAWVSAMAYAALVSGIGAGSFLTGMLRVRLPFETIYRWSALCPLVALLLAVPALASRARSANARE
jgi:predicted MFS family arabinose efflux permease